MLYNLYVLDRNVLHLCFWTLPALLLAVAMVAVGLVHGHRQEKRKKEFEEQLSDLYARIRWRANSISERIQKREVLWLLFF